MQNQIKGIKQRSSRCLRMQLLKINLNEKVPLRVLGSWFFFFPLTLYLCCHHRQDICRARDKCDTLGKVLLGSQTENNELTVYVVHMLMRKCSMLFSWFKDLPSWGRCVIHTGAAVSARTMDSALHSLSPMNLAMCKHSLFPLIVCLNSVTYSNCRFWLQWSRRCVACDTGSYFFLPAGLWMRLLYLGYEKKNFY